MRSQGAHSLYTNPTLSSLFHPGAPGDCQAVHYQNPIFFIYKTRALAWANESTAMVFKFG